MWKGSPPAQHPFPCLVPSFPSLAFANHPLLPPSQATHKLEVAGGLVAVEDGALWTGLRCRRTEAEGMCESGQRLLIAPSLKVVIALPEEL